MNFWKCDHPECDATAVGVGGAIGLHAVGWQFRMGDPEWGSVLLCPFHRTDKVPCKEEGDNHGKPCGPCAAEEQVKRIQSEWVEPR